MPFQLSASGSGVPGALMYPPAALQALADGHDTPDSCAEVVAAGLGVTWMRQLVPFQRSASVAFGAVPTAVQALAAEHDTPESWVPVAPAGLGTGWIFQLVPFQRSAKGTSLLALLT